MYTQLQMNTVLTIQKMTEGSITMEEARELLWVSERTLYRYKSTYLDEWPPGFLHGLQGKPSNNRNNKREGIRRYVQKKKYDGFGPTLLSECLERELGYVVPVSSLRRRMVKWWVWLPRKPRPPKRRPRRRKDGYGMMLQFDGSYHDWLEDGQERCLLIAVDDATWQVPYASFARSENIDDVIDYWIQYFQRVWKPSCVYLDRHSSYKVNHRSDQFDHKTVTRFQRAMQRLGVQVIFARSPQWKGRVENKFRTFQDRGIKMMRLAKLRDYKEAEQYLQEELVPSFNKKFGKDAQVKWDFHVPLTEHEDEQLEWSFGKRSTRVLNKVGVVKYCNKRYLINEWQTLEWREITVVHTHLWNIQLWSGNINLSFEEVRY